MNKKRFVQKELKTALGVLDLFPNAERFIIPVRLDDCEVCERKLMEHHWVDLFPESQNQNELKKILQVVNPGTFFIRNEQKEITNNSVECEVYLKLKNTAKLKESDTGEQHKAHATVIIYTGPCDDLGCTRTQGYWKNHSKDWPEGYKPNDDFFSSDKSWLNVLKTPPKKGDAYYILAHQYIAAVLNEASSADVPLVVKVAMEKAKSWFEINKNPPVPASSPDGQDAVSLAKILDDYNNGKMGVPHCDKDKK